MKKIILTGKIGLGKFALVDDGDYQKINSIKWYFCEGYARHDIRFSKTSKKIIFMHRVVLNNFNRNIEIDHINGDKLDNRRNNLRIVTRQQNMFNRRKRKLLSSKYKGVSWNKKNKNWRAMIRINNRTLNIGSFRNEQDAASAYDIKAKEIFGEYSHLNIGTFQH
ncbi:MAG: HNH endonuclease [Nanoarchaeota archaeon]